jgi:hypothetical protein
MAYRVPIEKVIILKNGKKTILEEDGTEFCEDLWREIKSYLFIDTPLFWTVMDSATRRLTGADFGGWGLHHSGNFNDAIDRNPNKTIVDFAKRKYWKPYLKSWFRDNVFSLFNQEFARCLKHYRERVAKRGPIKKEDWEDDRVETRRRTLLLDSIRDNLRK